MNVCHLTPDISFLHALYLPFPHHIYHFVCPRCSLCRFKRVEARSWLAQPFDEAMILFADVVETLDLPQFHAFRQDATRCAPGMGFRGGRMLIDSDHARSARTEVVPLH